MNIKLDREELNKIVRLMDKFKDINVFEIHQERSSGIGISTVVRFNGDQDEEFPMVTEIDITDYGKW